MRMVEAGIVGEGEPVELLQGVLTEVSAKSPEHEAIKMRLMRWLQPGSRHDVRVEAPLTVPDTTSLPEPDIAVVERGDYLARHPSSALLVVEVAASSLQVDTAIKPALYAAASVPEFWVVDVPARRLVVFRDPDSGGYDSRTVLGPKARAQPLRVDVPPLEIGDLFSGLGGGWGI